MENSRNMGTGIMKKITIVLIIILLLVLSHICFGDVMRSHLTPITDSTLDVGSTELFWRAGYFDNLFAGDILATGDVTIQGDLTVGGSVLGFNHNELDGLQGGNVANDAFYHLPDGTDIGHMTFWDGSTWAIEPVTDLNWDPDLDGLNVINNIQGGTINLVYMGASNPVGDFLTNYWFGNINTLAKVQVDGLYNIAIGGDAGENVTTGDDNILIGEKAGEDITTGTDNIAIGSDSGGHTVTGSDNISIGDDAG